jgi:hypothetical protein
MSDKLQRMLEKAKAKRGLKRAYAAALADPLWAPPMRKMEKPDSL